MLVDTHKIIFTVAPLVGAWIEISNVILVVLLYLVAPLVGAWIEICGEHLTELKVWSLPSWERGLKFASHTKKRGLLCRSPRGSVD